MDRESILALADRVEQLPVMKQGAAIEDAWELLAATSSAFRKFACSYESGFDTKAGKLGATLDTHAFESAAMMLVPAGWNVCRWTIIGKPDSVRMWNDAHEVLAGAATPALALTAAALRVRAALKGQPHGE